jgi:PAS domain S-box-containing protein/putative nucleotidyltransferase with HDIG domain
MDDLVARLAQDQWAGALLEAIPDPAWLLDAAGQVHYANRRAQRFGAGLLPAVAHLGTTTREVELLVGRPGAEAQLVRVSSSPLHLDGQVAGTCIVARPLPGYSRREAELAERNRALSALNDLAAQLLRLTTRPACYDAALDGLLTIVGARTGAFLCCDDAHQRFELVALRGAGAGTRAILADLTYDTPGAHNLARTTGDLVVIHAGEAPRPGVRILDDEGAETAVLLPVPAGAGVGAILSYLLDDYHDCTVFEREILRTAATYIGLALERLGLLDQAEAERARLAGILDALPVGVHIGERDAGGAERWTSANTAAHRQLAGQTLDPRARGVVHRPDGQVFAFDDLPASRALVHGEASPPTELVITYPDGATRLFLSSSSVLRDTGDQREAVVIAQEITDLRAAEAALRQSEERFAKAFQASPDALIISRLADGLILDVNDRWPALFGYTREDMVGHRATEIGLWPDPATRAQTAAVLAVEGVLYDFEVPLRRKSGEMRLCTLSVQVLDLPGEPCILSHVRDITERRAAEDRLRHQLSFTQAITESLGEGVYAIDRAGRCTFANPAAAQMLGWAAADLEGTLIHDRIHYQHADGTPRPARSCPILAVWRTGAPVQVDDDVFTRQDGTTFPVAYNAAPILTGGKVAGAVVVFRDVSEPRAAQAQIARQLAHLTALRRIDVAIAGSRDLAATLYVVLDQVMLQMQVDAAAVLLREPGRPALTYAATRGFHSHPAAWPDLPAAAGYPGQAMRERRALVLPDLAAAPGFERPDLAAAEGFRAYYVVPLIVRGAVLGALEVYQRAPRTFAPDWRDFLGTLAGQAAIAIDNARLFTDLQRSNDELAAAYDTTLEGWARALDLRDRETLGHTQRVTERTLALARTLGFAEPDLLHLRRGALLHDIGKMAIPDAILLKPGPLTADARAVMRRHPVYAYELLAPIAFLRPALDIPYCHHERWDGTGYPRGLRGPAIPLAARVFAVVDVWDALLSDRPYRPAWPAAQVRAYIRARAGTHFDPAVVAAFLAAEC